MSLDEKYEDLEKLSKTLLKLSSFSQSYLNQILWHLRALMQLQDVRSAESTDQNIQEYLKKLPEDLRGMLLYQDFSKKLFDFRIEALLQSGVSPMHILRIPGSTEAFFQMAKEMENPLLKDALAFWEEHQDTLAFEDKRLFNLMLFQVIQLERIKAEGNKPSYELLASLRVSVQSFPNNILKENVLKYIENEEKTTFKKKTSDEKRSLQYDTHNEMIKKDLKKLDDLIEKENSEFPKELRESVAFISDEIEKYLKSPDCQPDELDELNDLGKAVSYCQEVLYSILEKNTRATMEYAILLASLSESLPGKKSETFEKIGKALVVVGALSLGAAGFTIVATLMLPGVGILLGSTLAALLAGGALASFLKSKEAFDKASEKGPAKGARFLSEVIKNDIQNHKQEGLESQGLENKGNTASKSKKL